MIITTAPHLLSSYLEVILASNGLKHIAAAGWAVDVAMMGHLPDPAFVGVARRASF